MIDAALQHAGHCARDVDTRRAPTAFDLAPERLRDIRQTCSFRLTQSLELPGVINRSLLIRCPSHESEISAFRLSRQALFDSSREIFSQGHSEDSDRNSWQSDKQLTPRHLASFRLNGSYLSDIALNATVCRVESFGALCKAIRLSLGLSQGAVAERGGIPEQKRISDLEAGASPRIDRARQIAIGLGFSSLTELVALWEGIDLPQTDEGLKQIATAADDRSRSQESRLESKHMGERDPFRRAVLGSYESIAHMGKDVRQAFATRIAQIAGEFAGEATPTQTRRKKSGNK